MLHRAIISTIFDRPSREFDVKLWDGRTLARRRAGPGVAGHLVIRSPAAAARLAPPVDERTVAEAFLDGQIDVVGDTVGVLEAVARWEGPRFSLPALPVAASTWARGAWSRAREAGGARGHCHTVASDARAVRRHYDVSNDFYRLFLDDQLVYSCGYFSRGDESIDEAQDAKLELVCRKLALQPDQRLLDVGCGWGALLLHAARHFRVRAVGATISRQQFSEARRRAAAAGIGSKVQVLDCDYRLLPLEPVDKIASIGMMEHVGAERLDEYFGELYRRLRPGGLLLNQAIADISHGVRIVRWLPRPFGSGFIDREIFPDSELPTLGAVIGAAERQGLEVRDVECLREHYSRTLEQWLARLERRFDEAVERVGLRTARAWRLYLAISAVGFRLGRLGIYQTLLARRTETGAARGVPRARESWQRDPLVGAACVSATA